MTRTILAGRNNRPVVVEVRRSRKLLKDPRVLSADLRLAPDAENGRV